MLVRRTVLALIALALGGLPLALAGGGDHRCHAGPAEGHWNLPGDHGPGFARGALFVEGHDHPVLLLDAELHATHPGEGVIAGVLRSAQHPHDDPRFVVLGHWVSNDEGHGAFEAEIFRAHDGGHHRVGRMGGHFDDPPGGDPHHDPVGAFQGEWRICD